MTRGEDERLSSRKEKPMKRTYTFETPTDVIAMKALVALFHKTTSEGKRQDLCRIFTGMVCQHGFIQVQHGTWHFDAETSRILEARQHECTKTHHKLYIDMTKVASDQDLATIIDMLRPNQAEPTFMGLFYVMSRYAQRDTAYARALDIECAVYCGHIEIEEVSA
jgi:hypothetical protein